MKEDTLILNIFNFVNTKKSLIYILLNQNCSLHNSFDTKN